MIPNYSPELRIRARLVHLAANTHKQRHPPQHQATARFTPQQVEDSLLPKQFNANRPWIHPKVLPSYHFEKTQSQLHPSQFSACRKKPTPPTPGDGQVHPRARSRLPATQTSNANRPWIHPKVLPSYHFGTSTVSTPPTRLPQTVQYLRISQPHRAPRSARVRQPAPAPSSIES
jgi:hypothetical protein